MLNPIDFLHDTSDSVYPINPNRIHQQIVVLLDKKDGQWSEDDHIRFSLLNRLIWCLSILDTIDCYKEYTEVDIHTFFMACDMFIDVLQKFNHHKSVGDEGNQFFKKTIEDLNFPNGIIKDDADYKFFRFVRSLIVAHTSSTNSGDGFLGSNVSFVLDCVDLYSAQPTNEDLNNEPEVFYVHALLNNNCQHVPIIFKIYIDELKKYLQAVFKNRVFDSLKNKELRK